MASSSPPALPCIDAVEPKRPPPALATELLDEILLRVASPGDLVRASAACASFRRLIADRSFLRRYRSMHPPLLLGFASIVGSFHPVKAPHLSAGVARAVARVADFSLDYLRRPTTECCVCDVRNGRVLACSQEKGATYWDLVVCDPLSRRYLLLPPMNDDLISSVDLQNQKTFGFGASFIPSRGPSGGIEEDTSFSVILWITSNTRLGVFIFSSGSSCWSVRTSISWGDLGLDKSFYLNSGQCAHDCFYWKLYNSTVLKLDMNSMQFCTVHLPPDIETHAVVIVESGENKVAMFSLSYEGTSLDYYTFSRNGSENSHDWHMTDTIPLPADYNIKSFFMGPAEGYIFLQGTPIQHNEKHYVVFSLEIKSLKIERVGTTSYPFGNCPYFGFPPSMSPIRIQGYGHRYEDLDSEPPADLL